MTRFVNFTLLLPLCYALKWENARLFVYMAASAYCVISKELDNGIFRHNCIFRHTFTYKNPIMTKQWNYNILVKISYGHLRYTDRPLDTFSLLLSVILSELHEELRRKDRVIKNIYRRICVRNTTFLAARPRPMSFFVAFLVYSLLSSTLILRWKKSSPKNGRRSQRSPLLHDPDLQWSFFCENSIN